MEKMKILVWDLPVRLFHWMFAGAFAVAWLTSEADNWLMVHILAGYLILGLLVFRLLWGFVGGRYARFASFRFSPGEGFRYLKQALAGTAMRHIGHNPAGSWGVYLLLSLGLLTGLAGLATLGGQEGQGPLAVWVSFAAGEAFEEVHEFLANTMMFVVVLHLAGVALESWHHRENLPRAMLTGIKDGSPDASTASRRLFSAMLLLLAVVAGIVWFLGGTEYNAGYKISRSIDPRETPLRITETPYWVGKHRHIALKAWSQAPIGSKANCVACHKDVEQGRFAGAAIPRGVTARFANSHG